MLCLFKLFTFSANTLINFYKRITDSKKLGICNLEKKL